MWCGLLDNDFVVYNDFAVNGDGYDIDNWGYVVMEEYKYKYLEDYVEKRLGEDKDLFDLNAIVDWTLSYNENLGVVQEYIDEKFGGENEGFDVEGAVTESNEHYNNNLGDELCLGEGTCVEMKDVVGKCLYMVGCRGSGKSYKTGTILEQLLESNIRVLVIDSERDFRFVQGDDVLHIKHDDERSVVELLYNGKNVIVDVSMTDKKERKEYVKQISRDLLVAGIEERKPVFLFVDEAEDYAGQYDAIPDFVELIRKGRKRGIGVVMAGHRISRLEKSILSEFDYSMFKRTTLDIDIKRITDYVKQLKGIDREKVLELSGKLHSLNCDETLLVDSGLSSLIFVKDLKRKFRHGGNTPRLDGACYEEWDEDLIKGRTEGSGMNNMDYEIKRNAWGGDDWRRFSFDVFNLIECLLVVFLIGALMWASVWWGVVGGMALAFMLVAGWKRMKHNIVKKANGGGGNGK